VIDSHHHFWDYEPTEYEWISEGMERLKRDYGPEDLRPELEQAGVQGVISVQARTSREENDFLLAHARAQDFVRGVVGWLDFTAAGVSEALERYAGDPLLVGFRHVLQGEPDERYMLRDDFNAGLSHLHEFGFIYDILIREIHLPHVPAFVDQHPGLTFVLDHLAKPRIDSETPSAGWVRGIREVARRESVVCKLSGMVTEVSEGLPWSVELLRPYFEEALEAFGPSRLLFGSDWPVCRLRAEYGSWVAAVRSFLEKLSREEQAAILGENARRVYGLR